jgi:hypothetical protein
MRLTTDALVGLFTLFFGTVVIYLLRHYLVLGCVIGVVLCLIGLYIIGRIETARKRRGEPPTITLPEGATIAAAVGTEGSSFLVRVVKAVAEPITEAVKLTGLISSHSEVRGRLAAGVIPPPDREDSGA